MDCPAEAPSTGPVPVRAEFVANRRTYWDTNGIIDDALNVLFVRNDRPGMVAIAKIPPNAYMLPNKPLKGRPSDEELDKSTHRVRQIEQYDLLAYGREHPGSADYFVVAAFSDAWQGPTKMRLTSAELDPGNYALFAFVGHEAAPVQVFKVE